MRLFRARSPYRPKNFWWCDADSIFAAFVLIVFMWLCLAGLPAAAMHGMADEMRARLIDLGFTVQGGR